MHGEEAKSVLVRQIDESLLELKASPGSVGCPAHMAIARSMATMLECQRAQLTGETTNPPTTSARASVIGAGSGTAAGGLVIAIFELLQHFNLLR